MFCLLLKRPLEKGCWRKYWEPPLVASSGNPAEGVQSPGPDRAGLGLTPEDGSLAEETDTYIDNYTADDSWNLRPCPDLCSLLDLGRTSPPGQCLRGKWGSF